jgi:hypothetical protein
LRRLPQVHALRGTVKELGMDLLRRCRGICPYHKPKQPMPKQPIPEIARSGSGRLLQ